LSTERGVFTMDRCEHGMHTDLSCGDCLIEENEKLTDKIHHLLELLDRGDKVAREARQLGANGGNLNSLQLAASGYEKARKGDND
jgi:hypothetical protein